MSTPSAMFSCPRCRAVSENESNYCGQCGAAMHAGAATGDTGAVDEPPRDRRRLDADPWIGRVIDARYRVIECIGQGGMGMVYKVEHQRMGKVAAMKVLHRELAGDREVVRRFRREAEAVSRLNHPNT